MYPSVNITRTISYILKVVFKNSKSFFKPEKNKKGYTLPIPTREEFKLFLLAILKDFNIFDSQIGTFKQLKDLQMGNTLALLISNLFIGCLESEVIKKLIKRGVIISWTRYADDTITIIKKGSYDTVFKAINSWDQDVNYTGEKMTENEIKFLSCTIFIQKGSIEFKTFRKSQTIMSNYRHSVMSKRYLNNNIITQLNHSENSCSNEDIFLQDLPDLKEILLRNEYPESIIVQKIFDFLCNPEKPPKPEISFTLSISYTSPKIEFYVYELLNRIKNFLPNFYVRCAYKSIKIGVTFIRDGKPAISKLNSCNCIYQFKCPCLKGIPAPNLTYSR